MSNLLDREKKINEIEALKSKKHLELTKSNLINEIKSLDKEEFIKLTANVEINLEQKSLFQKIREWLTNFFNKF